MNDAPGAQLDLARARLLVEMAEIALGDLSGEVFLPDGWDLLQLVRAGGGAAPRARGFYAAGRLAGPSSPRVAVLALGLPWQEYLDWTLNRDGKVEMAALPAGIGAPPDARFDATLGSVYTLLRGAVWKHLAQALTEGRGTLWITGRNLAGPLAQLAAVDLRPGHPGPQGEPPPATAPACLTFSTAPAGNAAFKTFADASGGAVANVWARAADLPADFFPTAPGQAQGYVLPGTLEPVDATVTDLDDPWTERGGPFYLRALKGRPDGIAVPGEVRDPPAGFIRTLAHMLAKLSLVAYQRRQNPDGAIVDVAPYRLTRELSSGGVPWCALFESTTAVVASFRGTVSSDELARITADSAVATPGFLAGRGRVHGGVLRLYTGPSADATPFRAALAQWLRANAAGRPVHLTGHDLGGALAALAALDLRTSAPELKVEKVYAFGSTPLGDYDFGLLYAARLAADSYQVVRDVDFARRLQLMSAYDPLPRTVVVTGAPAADDASRHSLTSYIRLLDTTQPGIARGAAVTPASARKAPPPLSAAERAWMEARLASMGVVPPPRLEAPAAPVLVAGPDGRVVLSTDAEESALRPLVPADGGAPVFVAEVLDVAAGDTLVVRPGEGEPPRLVVGRLTLGEGARVSLPPGAALHAATTGLGDGVVFKLIGKDGGPGKVGKPGDRGAYGGSNHIDGWTGDRGGPGDDGGPGGGALYLGRVTGTVTVLAGGGNGGPGGPGGHGGDGADGSGYMGHGAGGDGGPGGPGGRGGPGGTAVVAAVLEPGGILQLVPRLSGGGAGGGGGEGGHAGTGGSTDKPDGNRGAPGDAGGPGDLPVFSVRYHDDDDEPAPARDPA